MSIDDDLQAGLAPLARASFAEAAPVPDLRHRADRRRRRRRQAVAGSILGVSVLVGALVAAGRPAGDGPRERLTTDRAVPSTTSPPAPPSTSFGPGLRLVVGRVPEGLASEGCGTGTAGERSVSCGLGIPTTNVPDGANVTLLQQPVDEAVAAAWDRRDAVAFAGALIGDEGAPAFREVAGRPVVAVGETDRVSGEWLGVEDRVSSTFLLLLQGRQVQVHVEGLAAAQVDELLAGIGVEPAETGITVPDGALPADATLVAQGPERPWFQPDPLHPERSTAFPGRTDGATFEVGTSRQALQVQVLRDVDPEPFLERWTRSMDGRRGDVVSVDHGGRTVLVAELGGQPVGQPPIGLAVACRIDDRTVALVTGPARIRDELVDLAAAIR